jgi:hypothetical protein
MAESKGGGGGGSDFFFFLGIIILFFFLWVASGGPSRPLSFAGPYLNPITNTGTNPSAYGDPNAYNNISGGISIGGWGVGVTGGTTNGNVANNSSYAEKVMLIRDPSGAKEKDEKEEYVSIMVSSLATEGISTAGWKLVSQKGGSGASFPQGAENPQSGKVNVLSAITLKAGDTATIVTGRSPVGISFRENKCTGYFEERQDFNPPLTENCPTPFQEYDRFYDEDDDDEECSSFVRSIPYCSTDAESSSDISSPCENFVEDYLNYNGCFDAHKKETGFYSPTWRIFLGKTDELWRQEKETILLIDAEGKTIDSMSY